VSILKLRALLAVALAAAVLVGVRAAPAGADGADYSHLDVGFAEGANPPSLPADLDAMIAYAGRRKPFIRLDLDWGYVQPARCVGAPSCAMQWDHLDPIVDAAADKGVRVLIILGYGAGWATGHPESGKWFPTNDADWADLVDRTVAHFGAKVQAYEVWNEPNLIQFGNYGGDSSTERKARYWQLAQVAHDHVHAACPGCVVLAGGSAGGNDAQVPDSTTRNDNESAQWLQYAYDHGYRNSFDAVADHPYPAANSGFGPDRPECTTRWWNLFGPDDPKCGELAAVRQVMVNNADAAKKIWATEWGYPTAGNAKTPDIETIRDYQVEGVHMWRQRDYTGPLFLYSYRDHVNGAAGPCSQVVDPECDYGVVTVTGAAKEPLTSDLAQKFAERFADVMANDTTMRRWAHMPSPDGHWDLWLQGDGNLVLYHDGKAAWATNTSTGERLSNQTDGNLVLYDKTGHALWDTKTYKKDRAHLQVQNDGNLVLYSDVTPGTHTWARF
jgi:polysaccharide biosynthesis protein PslG